MSQCREKRHTQPEFYKSDKTTLSKVPELELIKGTGRGMKVAQTAQTINSEGLRSYHITMDEIKPKRVDSEWRRLCRKMRLTKFSSVFADFVPV